jgi:hypothetical protein
VRARSLTLREVRGFASRTFDLDRSTNVLFGDNGTGKSTVISALAWCLAAFVPGVQRAAPTERDLRYVWREVDGRAFREAAAHGSVELDLDVDGAARKGGWVITRHDGGTPSADLKKLSTWVQRRPPTADLPLVAVFRVHRRWQDVPAPGDVPVDRLDGYDGALDAGAHLGAVRGWFRDETLRRLTRGASPALDAVEVALQRFLGGGDAPLWDTDGSDVIVHLPKRGARVGLRDLSDGYRNLVGIVVELARRSMTLNPHRSPGDALNVTGVVAIDEIDLHLHPSWQRSVLPGLRDAFPNVQLIVTTHSPQVLASVRSNDEVVSLDDGDRLLYVRGRDTNSILESGMNAPYAAHDEVVRDVLGLIEGGDLAAARARIDALAADWGPYDRTLTELQLFLDTAD